MLEGGGSQIKGLREIRDYETLRWQLIERAGKPVRHGRRLVLRLAASLEKYRLLLEIRRMRATFH
jgi:hypothetical protein